MQLRGRADTVLDRGRGHCRGNWLIGASFEQHAISDVVSGTDELRDASDRERFSNSLLLEAGYGLTSRVSLTGMLILVRHERQVSSSVGVGEDIQTSGLSGGILMMKYTLQRQSVQFSGDRGRRRGQVPPGRYG
jgi:hypothetical protein